MIYFCADDYGITLPVCKRINECVAEGALNRISIVPNTELADIKKLVPKGSESVGIHVNLVEGKAVSPPQEIPLLADSCGYFKNSFAGLFLLSISKKRREFKKQVYCEIRNQILRWQDIMGEDFPVEIDSHQHTHMIPAIFGTLMNVIKDEHINVRYMRIPSEPISPYVKSPSLYFTYKPINIVKQWILKIFGAVNKKKFRKSGIKSALFMGVLFSGNMDGKRVSAVLKKYIELSLKKNCDIEVLFHPGYIEPGEEVPDKDKKGFVEFYLSEGRKTEFNTLKNIKIK